MMWAQVRAGMEMAVLDAVAHTVGLPLWQLFGGHSDSVTTDITVRILSANYPELKSLRRV